MNLLLAELINGIPPVFSVVMQNKKIIIFSCENVQIEIELFEHGLPHSMIYYKNYNRERPASEGPAIRCWYRNGQCWDITYIENGNWHRPSSEGPAYESWHYDGSSHRKEYWENGKQLSVYCNEKELSK